MSSRSVAWAVLAAVAGCSQAPAPAPYGEVRLSIDTDLDVDRTKVDTLRIDLFHEDGRWFASRTATRDSLAKDWPASFSLYTTDPVAESVVVARLRLYPVTLTRRYTGERFQDRASYSPPAVWSSRPAMCAGAPELSPGVDTVVRVGPFPFEASSPACVGTKYVGGGASAAKLVIPAPTDGSPPTPVPYRFEVRKVVPDTADVAIEVRADCNDPSGVRACSDDADPLVGDRRPKVDVALSPGTYSVVVLGLSAGTADATVRAGPVATWGAPPPAGPTGEPPRLLVDGGDRTPTFEPQPLVTIDRLVRVRIRPGVRETAPIVLRSRCGGTMAKLPVRDDTGQFDLSSATACVDEEGVRAPIEEAATLPGILGPHALTDHRLESLAGMACPPPDAAPREGTICVPGGVFVFGSDWYAGRGDLSSTPLRLARMTPFWMDADEVTVGDWRDALANGFAPSQPADANEDVISGKNTNARMACTWSKADRGRERYPLTCVPWQAAREYCAFRGGELPSEAQWEYAATKLRPGSTWEDHADKLSAPYTSWPSYSDSRDDCTLLTFGRDHGGLCAKPDPAADPLDDGFGPLPVEARSGLHQDVSDLGFKNLSGSASEYLLDAFGALDGPCWRAAPLTDPACRDDRAPQHPIRGGSWATPESSGRWLERAAATTAAPDNSTGFRCAYAIR